MKRTPWEIVKRQRCPMHKESRPCQTCFAKAEDQRDERLRAESFRLHQLYLREIHA